MIPDKVCTRGKGKKEKEKRKYYKDKYSPTL
jgi:hypothetical protein